MAEHLGKVKLKHYSNPFKLSRDSEVHTDELDFLGDAIETMESDLHSSYKQLAESKAHLEKEVIKRTAAYKEVLEREHRKRHLVTMGLMVVGVAHEIRNPLGTLANSTRFLRNNYSGPHHSVLDRMERSIGRCNAVVEELRTKLVNSIRLS